MAPLDAPETRYARNGDLDIAYQVVGVGPIDLVLFSEWWFNLDLQWEDPALSVVLQRLAGFCRLILFDTRGFGLSDPLPSDRTPSLEETVSDVLAVLDAVGAEEVAVLAVGDGAPAAILFAASHPARVRALAIVNGFARYAVAEDYPDGYDDLVLEAILTETRDHWGTPHDVPWVAPSLMSDPEYQKFFARATRQSTSRGGAMALTKLNFLMDVRSVLASVTTPTLVIHRRGDIYAPVGLGRYLAAHVADAELVELDGDDHLWWAGDSAALLREIERFFTGAAPAPKADRVLATILFTDIVQSTEQASAMGDHQWRAVLDNHDRLVQQQLSRFNGIQVKSLGDGVLARFDAPGRAVRCAQAIAADVRQLGISIRAGLHTGEVEVRGEDVAGVAVHIGARVAALAAADEVLVSSTVKDLVVGSDIGFEDRGEHELKGVPGRWRVYAVTT